MPVLCDFTTILGVDDDGDEVEVTIGDANTEMERMFNTGGRESGSPAFLILNVRGLTHANEDVPVRINGVVVGSIRRYPGEETTQDYWFTQMIPLKGSALHDGNNTLEIRAVSWTGATNGNLFDDFTLKSVVCFFHQSA